MNRSLLVATLIAGAGILLLVQWLNEPSAVYSMSVSEFASRGLWDRPVRLQGTLVHGTLCRGDGDCGYRFRVADSRSLEQLSIRYGGCALPDTFRDLPGIDVEVTVEGERCRNCHDFEASRIMAKCPSKYAIPRLDGGHLATALPLRRCASLTPRM